MQSSTINPKVTEAAETAVEHKQHSNSQRTASADKNATVVSSKKMQPPSINSKDTIAAEKTVKQKQPVKLRKTASAEIPKTKQ